MAIRIPTEDLCGMLRNDPDEELPVEVCSASNCHLRWFVAGWMLSDGSDEGDARGLRDAVKLYDGCGQDLLDRPGRLTTEAVVAEVLMLTADRVGA